MKTYKVLFLTLSAVVLSSLFAFTMLTHSWTFDEKDAKIHFSLPNGKHDGTLSGLMAIIQFDPLHPELSKIKATVDVNSINTGVPNLDAHLQTADFFDVAHHPMISFTTDSIMKTDSGFVAMGRLAIRDSVHVIRVPFQFTKGEKNTIIKGSMDIFAGDYGVGKKSEKGNDRVLIDIEIPLTNE